MLVCVDLYVLVLYLWLKEKKTGVRICKAKTGGIMRTHRLENTGYSVLFQGLCSPDLDYSWRKYPYSRKLVASCLPLTWHKLPAYHRNTNIKIYNIIIESLPKPPMFVHHYLQTVSMWIEAFGWHWVYMFFGNVIHIWKRVERCSVFVEQSLNKQVSKYSVNTLLYLLKIAL